MDTYFRKICSFQFFLPSLFFFFGVSIGTTRGFLYENAFQKQGFFAFMFLPPRAVVFLESVCDSALHFLSRKLEMG